MHTCGEFGYLASLCIMACNQNCIEWHPQGSDEEIMVRHPNYTSTDGLVSRYMTNIGCVLFSYNIIANCLHKNFDTKLSRYRNL